MWRVHARECMYPFQVIFSQIIIVETPANFQFIKHTQIQSFALNIIASIQSEVNTIYTETEEATSSDFAQIMGIPLREHPTGHLFVIFGQFTLSLDTGMKVPLIYQFHIHVPLPLFSYLV